ncbi:hypothetical protein BGZ47_004057, partial [Haplosporangium gracile]
MPPRKRHHAAWNPSEGTARPSSSPLPPLPPHEGSRPRTTSQSSSHHLHSVNGDGLGITSSSSSPAAAAAGGRTGLSSNNNSNNGAIKNGTAHLYSVTEHSTSVSYTVTSASGPKSPPPTTTSTMSTTTPKLKRVSSSSPSLIKSTSAPYSVPSFTTPSPKLTSSTLPHSTTATSVAQAKTNRRTSTATTTATPTPEQETPPPTSSSSSTLNGTSTSTSKPPTSSTQITATEEIEEELTKKRFKNTLAARRSRAKKVMILEQERLRATELESANKALQIRVAVLEAEQKQWAVVKEAQALRIVR